MIKLFVTCALVAYCLLTYAAPFEPCHTEKTVTKTKDEWGDVKVSETSKTICSDKLGHVLQDTGAAKNCGLYTYTVTLGGRPVQQQGLACEKFNGNWEVIPNYSSR
jgi:surface antigen